MALTAQPARLNPAKSLLDRALSLFTDVRAGEGATAVLMLLNIFLLLICYSVIKTVREPLILLGGGAEVRSYAAAGQALLLMGFVPVYGWIASKVDRLKLLVGVTLFFVACIELFASAVAVGLPFVGVAFFIWVGIFNISLVAQFWSFANDVYSKDAGSRLFPIIVMGMTAGAPLGSFVAARLFRLGIQPELILQLSAVLLLVSIGLYLAINRRVAHHQADAGALESGGGFALVLQNPHLRLVAALVVLLNVVNTTGEYLVARLLSSHVAELALADPGFNRQAYIGAFSGDYQFWVNVTAFLLQAFVASRLVKYKGLAGVLLALPLIALGGYALIAVGFGFSVIRWVKTAENATDYSIMNTARQLLWLPATREEKYKAKQAIDTFFVRAGDVLSAGVVLMGTHVMNLTPQQFAIGNIVLTLVWLGVALRIMNPTRGASPRMSFRPVAAGACAVVALVLLGSPAFAQDTREQQQAAERAEKASRLKSYEPNTLERRIQKVEHMLTSDRPVYLAMGSSFDGGGLAFGPGYRARYGDTGRVDARATWSIANYKTADAKLTLPTFGDSRVALDVHGDWLSAPSVRFYGVGNQTSKEGRSNFEYRSTTVGVGGTVKASKRISFGGALDVISAEARTGQGIPEPTLLDPTYRRTTVNAQFDSRTSPDYTRRGSLARIEWADYNQTSAGTHSFRRVDAEVQQFVPLMRENWVLAFRGLVSTTDADAGQDVPYFLMPELGGSRLLRGYSSWRFRDRNRMLISGEYRWTAGPLVDMAVFVDAGKVTARRADLNFKNLEVSRGIGVRIHTPSATVTRLEVARSHEGTSLILSFSPSF
ncbi:MAG: BamA/TamA family outer membrane protein [Vicinamibacterales bacterium]